MPLLAHKEPCPKCPWRRTSAPGWLGSASPQEFLGATLAEAHMPCHSALDYEDPNWRDKLPTTPHCAGSLVFLRNVCALPRDPDLAAKRAQVEGDHANVFSRPEQFLVHHDIFKGGDA